MKAHVDIVCGNSFLANAMVDKTFLTWGTGVTPGSARLTPEADAWMRDNLSHYEVNYLGIYAIIWISSLEEQIHFKMRWF